MGLLSSLGGLLPVIGGVIGSAVPGVGTALGTSIGAGIAGIAGGNQAKKGIQKTAQQTLAIQKQGLDYAKAAIDPRLKAEQQARDALLPFFLGGAGQQQFINDAKNSPFYSSMIDTGEQGVLRNLSATGGLRTGTANEALAQNSQNVLQQLVNQKIQGLGNFARPTDISAIPQLFNQQATTVAQAGTAQNQASQDTFGNLIKLGTTVAGMI